jgi:hypothetical protein
VPIRSGSGSPLTRGTEMKHMIAVVSLDMVAGRISLVFGVIKHPCCCSWWYFPLLGSTCRLSLRICRASAGSEHA